MYKSFGFNNNPFSVLPLKPTDEDAGLFVGRPIEVNSFQVDIASEDRSLVMVTGHRGVGKTSFVSMMQYMASPLCTHTFQELSVTNKGLIPCYHKVQIDPDETVSNLLFKALTSLLFSVREFQLLQDNAMFPKDLQPLLDWVANVVPTTSNSAGISIAGFGATSGGGNTYRSVKDIPAAALCEQIKQVVKCIKILGCKGIFLNLDNLEIVDESDMARLMNHLRDYLFEINGLWIVLIGYPGMYSVITSQANRVSEYMSGHETFLGALTENDCIEVLELRKKTLSISSSSKLPLEESFIRKIYQNTDGEIRTVLKACDDITRSVFKANPTIKIITEEIGLPFLKVILMTQLGLASLKSKDREILSKIVSMGNIRPKDFSILSLKSAVDFTNKARPLLEKNLIRKQLDGTASKYEASGSVRLAVYAGINLEKD